MSMDPRTKKDSPKGPKEFAPRESEYRREEGDEGPEREPRRRREPRPETND